MTAGLLNALEARVESFAVPLRLGEGFDPEALASLREILEACAAAWRTLDSIPKRAANLFYDLAPSTQASASLYPPDISALVERASADLDALVRDCIQV